MHFCRKCGNKLQKNSKCCNTCGSELEKIHKEEINSITDKDKLLDNEIFNDEHILEHKEEPLEIIRKFNLIKKIKENKVFLIAILILIIIVTPLIKNPIKNFVIRKNPANWLVYAADKCKKSDTLDTVSDFKIKSAAESQEFMNYKDIENIIEQCTLRVNNKINKKTNERYSKVSLIYKEENILNGEFYSNKEYMAISMPQLYKDIMYIKWEDVNKLINNNKENKDISETIDPKNYENVLNIKKSKYYDNVNGDYKEFFYNIMDDYVKRGDKVDIVTKQEDKEKTIKCDEIVVHLDNERIIKILNAFFQKMSKDENLKLLVRDKVFEFLSTVQKNQDLNKFNLSKEDADNIKRDFDSEYDSFMKELSHVEKIDKKASNGKINSLTKVKIDSRNYIRGLQSEISIDKKKTSFNFISNTVINSIDSKLHIKKIPKERAKDISKFTAKDREDIVIEMENNIQKIMFSKLNIK
ncbi:TPA: zinc ribbon domain-containing protein [Clostridium botulinum]|uniref:zinc ribbon domain-containing protein n=1 Tax=Clostridium botulinum TaxID=1491 RepID=UPI001C9B40EF|nr:zinc ribbon domain-containing protein [Clostridium botulinum]MBY6888341.1 zinc ribbon domain-containing protein [Clostridium botulinum]HBJ2611179.1 zinc ribbon domain-containing protein [Clostridium botulinum]